MKTIHFGTSFCKDMKRCMACGYKISKFDEVYNILQRGENLPTQRRAHILSGNWAGHWECHIAANWLLIWLDDGDDIYLVATGTHADLF